MMKTINKITREDVDRFRIRHNLTHGNAFDTYQQIATKSAIYPGKGTSIGLIYTALKGCGEAGEFAEHVGKAMRDDGFNGVEPDGDDPGAFKVIELTEVRREALIKELGDELWYLSAKCNELGITLSYAALVNLEKLCDRTERNALRGSGDSR